MKCAKILVSTLFVLFLSAFSSCCFGATDAEASNAPPKKFFVFPVIFQSPETGFALGAMCDYYPNIEVASLGQKPDELNAMFFYTQKNQYVGNLKLSKYFSQNAQWLLLTAQLGNYPTYFYGIGTSPTSETYTLTGGQINAGYLWKIKDNLYLGPSALYANFLVGDKTPGGLLDTSDAIIGSDGISATGIGFIATWDESKDFARKGFIITLQANDFSKAWGNPEDYTRINLDCRDYIPISQNQVVAIQGVLTSTAGSVPFEFMPSVGGTIRGIEAGKFCDKACLAFQGEYRFPVRGIFGMTVFGGFGTAAPSLGELNGKDIKAAGGLGFRFTLDKNNNIKLRLDVSGTFDNPLVYINFSEAF